MHFQRLPNRRILSALDTAGLWYRHKRILLLPSLLLGNLLTLPPAMAAEANYCQRDTIVLPDLWGGNSEKIDLEADVIEATNRNLVTLKGNAVLTQGGNYLRSDAMSYQKDTDTVEAHGNAVLFSRDGDRLETPFLSLQVSKEQGYTGKASIQNADRLLATGSDNTRYVSGRGNASRVDIKSRDLLILKDANYSFCPLGHDDVMIHASSLKLDNATATGYARNVVVRFQGLPIFYSPYLEFPLDDKRRSGFLSPRFGAAKNSGMVIEVPYYLNLAPNYDLTLYPRYLTSRGLQLGGNFRYMTEHSRGSLQGEYMPSDSNSTQSSRGAVTYRHQQDLSSRWHLGADLQYVSDNNYLDDFTNTLLLSSSTHVPRSLTLDYNNDWLTVNSKIHTYQTIDSTIPSTARPYDRLPQIQFNSSLPVLSDLFAVTLGGEVSNFSQSGRIEGWRYDLNPGISLPLETTYGFFKPKLELNNTTYSLSNVSTGGSTNPSRTVAIFSADSGLFFERQFDLAGQRRTQTLEPRLFYVYIPYKNQSALPNFDTGEGNFNNFSNLFRSNRFFGRDRVGDTNQLTMALTSRLLDVDSGDELGHLRLGQIFFFSDRRVQLSGATETTNQSDLLAELQLKLADYWTVNSYLQYSHTNSEVTTGKLNLSYNRDSQRTARLGYLYQKNGQEQLDLNVSWSLSPQWQVRVQQLYSITDSKSQVSSIGLQYNSCCWSLGLSSQRRLDNTGAYRNAVFATLELNHLGSISSGL